MVRFILAVGTVIPWMLQGEVVQVIVKWNAAICLNACTPGLEKNLTAIKAVRDLQINSRAGMAIMGWSPTIQFSYEPFNLATRMVGIRVSDIRVKVRGTIAHDAENFYLVSLGDSSRFRLIGPILPNPDQYTIRQNPETHPLAPSLVTQLLNAEKNQELVTVEGPLFEPNRYTLILITEQTKFQKKDEVDPKLKK